MGGTSRKKPKIRDKWWTVITALQKKTDWGVTIAMERVTFVFYLAF